MKELILNAQFLSQNFTLNSYLESILLKVTNVIL